MHPNQWKIELEINRKSKDDFFAQHQQSPIPMNKREKFDGLKYYPQTLNFTLN